MKQLTDFNASNTNLRDYFHTICFQNTAEGREAGRKFKPF